MQSVGKEGGGHNRSRRRRVQGRKGGGAAEGRRRQKRARKGGLQDGGRDNARAHVDDETVAGDVVSAQNQGEAHIADGTIADGDEVPIDEEIKRHTVGHRHHMGIVIAAKARRARKWSRNCEQPAGACESGTHMRQAMATRVIKNAEQSIAQKWRF